MVEHQGPGASQGPGGNTPVPTGASQPPPLLGTLGIPSLTEELSDCALFRPMPREQLNQLLSGAARLTFQKGDEVRPPNDKVFVILTGTADCFLRDAADSEFRLSVLGSGSPIGELSHLIPEDAQSNDGKVRIVAKSALAVVSLSAGEFLDAVMRTPDAGRELLSIFASRLSAMNRFANQAVDVNLNPSRVKPSNSDERLADWMTSRVGTFRFLKGLAVASGAWMVSNIVFALWDPYPYVFLNLIFSVMSATTTSVLLISQNRQSQLDRVKAMAGQRVLMRMARQLDTLTSMLQQRGDGT